MKELQCRILAIANDYGKRGQSLTDGALIKELPDVERETIRKAVMGLEEEGKIKAVPLNWWPPQRKEHGKIS